MALGISGSNGGIGSNWTSITVSDISCPQYYTDNELPLEVSYFVNDACNLKCKHCYVGYTGNESGLSVDEWSRCFDQLIELGAKTFGNVGMEPLGSWRKTSAMLRYFADKRDYVPGLRYGLVTNAILLNEGKAHTLLESQLDYLDISIDGDEDIHNDIRGEGTYSKTFENIKSLPPALKEKVYISFTLNKLNQHTLPVLVEELYGIGIRNFLISPYVTFDESDTLYLSNVTLARIISKLVTGELMPFNRYNNLSFYIKSDYTTSKGFMDALVSYNLIKTDAMYMDEYGVLFNYIEQVNNNKVFLNYYTVDTSYFHSLRITHDGYISRCLDMFYSDCASRAIGNIRTNSIDRILQGYKNDSWICVA